MKGEEIFEKLNLKKEDFDDLHITRNFSSFVAVSHGEIIQMTDPILTHCPLFSRLYKGNPGEKKKEIRKSIKMAVESKIKEFGSFTEIRKLKQTKIAVPYGASEMMMYAIRKGFIEAALSVCDGAGSVITDYPALVQGIGARMNGLFYTTPVKKIIDTIRKNRGIVVFPDNAEINQVLALEHAARQGYKRIAVTINGFTDEDISEIKPIEGKYGIKTVVIVVCTTDILKARTEHIARYADVVWSCASRNVREIIGSRSILQITTGIPVFVLTPRGMEFVSSYSNQPQVFRELDLNRQYLISGYVRGRQIKMGHMSTYLTESRLPIRSNKEPK